MYENNFGKCIADCRKEHGLTQAGLGEALGVTDRAVSKWETGKSLPDASIMLELTEILEINVNELLTGERIKQEDYKKMAEQNLVELKKMEEASNRAMLHMEIVIAVIGTVSFCALLSIATAGETLPANARIGIGALGTVLFVVAIYYSMKIEHDAGYYECPECGNRYVPSYAKMTFAPHMGRTRYMSCPQCGKRHWQKKVLTK